MTESGAGTTRSGSTNTDVPEEKVQISLGNWNIYFLAKFVLLWRGLIDFHPIYNLAFAVLLMLPIQSVAIRRIRSILAFPAAIALLYYDSWLPPIQRVWTEAPLVLNFTPSYLLELVGRFVNGEVIALLIVAWALYHMFSQKIRIGMLTVAALIALTVIKSDHGHSVPILVPSGPTVAANPNGESNSSDTKLTLNAVLQNFFERESHREIGFPQPEAGAPPFDIIFIHICSLSWDDIKTVGLENHPLWKNFDMLFSHFNSASTYSGPAAIRVLRSTCGQTTHKALYGPAPGNCYLMSSLQKAGYERNLGLNHNGQFGGFLQTIQTLGGLNIKPMPTEGLQIDQHAFDGSPVHDDLAVLSHWLDLRSKDKASRVALYYNTISLHDGNHLIDIKVSGDSIQTYKIRLKKLLDELDQFMQEIDSSGRRAVVVLVPEHGAAIREDKMQIAGLREIPSPAITLVPVGIKVVGPDAHRLGETLQIDKPTSFLAVSYIVEKMLEKSPYGSAGFNPDDYIDGLPTTNYVAQNASATTMKINGHYYLKEGDESWTNYDTGAQP